jgi:transposase
MIVPPTNVRVLIATKPVDFRKGMDGLAAHVQEAFKLEPYGATIRMGTASITVRTADGRVRG